MSTITAVRKGNQICLASESLTTFGSTKLNGDFIKDSDKIIKWGDSYVGIVGSVSVYMVLRDISNKEKKLPDFSNIDSIYKYFTKLHQVLKKKYFLNPSEDEGDPVESSQIEIIIANKHGIFGVHSLREIFNFQRFWSYGSGSDYALGAMNAVYDLPEFDAEKIAKAGVEAGITFDDASGGKILVHKIKITS